MADTVARQIEQAGERRSARVESLRALAACGVLVGHAYGWAHGYSPGIYSHYLGRLLLSGGFAVFLFFALSAYLLYLPFARAAFAGGGAVDVGRYARNRIVRILPLYYVVIAVFLALDRDGLRSQWWRFVLFSESLSPRTVARLDGPIWSLVVEVQFYVLLPMFAWAVAVLSRRRLAVAVALVGVVGAAALAVRVVTVETQPTVSAVWRYSLPATAVFFTPGLLLALVHARLDRGPASWVHRPWAHPAAWFAAGALLWLVAAYRYVWNPLLVVASALLLGACALPLRPTRLLRVMDLRPLAALGTASYSLYLWHEPIVARLARSPHLSHGFVRLVAVSLVVCCAVAAASYRLVEAPFLRLRRSWSPDRAAGLPALDGAARAWQPSPRSPWTPLPTTPPSTTPPPTGRSP